MKEFTKMEKLNIGQKYTVDQSLVVTYLGEVNGKGLFMRKAAYHPFVTWSYSINDKGGLSLSGGNYYSNLADVYKQ